MAIQEKLNSLLLEVQQAIEEASGQVPEHLLRTYSQLSQVMGGGGSSLIGSSQPVDVGDTLSQIFITSVGNMLDLGLQIANVGGAALSGFSLEARVHPGANWIVIADTTSEFTTLPSNSLIRFSSADPTTLSANASVSMGLKVTYFSDIRLQAASNGTQVLVLGGGS